MYAQRIHRGFKAKRALDARIIYTGYVRCCALWGCLVYNLLQVKFAWRVVHSQASDFGRLGYKSLPGWEPAGCGAMIQTARYMCIN